MAHSQATQKVAVVIVAAGRGTRAVAAHRPSIPKQYQLLGGTPLLMRTVSAFLTCDTVDFVTCVISEEDRQLYEDCMSTHPKLLAPALGGASRQASVFNGLHAIRDHAPDVVLIHDGARPFVNRSVINNCLEALKTNSAVVAGLPVFDTVKQVAENGTIERTIDRALLRTVQTPQGFAYPLIMSAHKAAAEAGRSDFTDDAAVAEWFGEPVKLVQGAAENIKLTTPADFEAAEARLLLNSPRRHPMETRVGSGFDVHAFEAGDQVIVGGVAIPHTQKLKGHSDADVALHVITDAIYGALADGDIGHHFPPSDPQWKGMDSGHFLQHARSRVVEQGGSITNVDLTIICETPKIGPHRPAIRTRIAELLMIDLNRVSVKATTTEKLGFTGRREGIAAQAVVSLTLPAVDQDQILPEELPFSQNLVERAQKLVLDAAKRELKIATAESCTGGLIAGLLTSVPGSSAVVERGLVTYSNEAKIEMLGVPEEMIATHGAVSSEVAQSMATGALQNSRADISVAVTGIAGPGGGSAEKPVGLIHFASAVNSGKVHTEGIVFEDTGRTGIRRATISHALTLLETAVYDQADR